MSLYSRSCKSFHIHVLVKHNNVFYRCNKELTFFIEVIKYVALVCFFFEAKHLLSKRLILLLLFHWYVKQHVFSRCYYIRRALYKLFLTQNS